MHSAFLLLLLCLLLHHLPCLAAAAASPGPAPLPVLDRSIETITCGPRTGCSPVSPGKVPEVCTTPNTVLTYDHGACFGAAVGHAGYRPLDLASMSGGEVVFCRQLYRLLNATGYTFLATRSAPALEACVTVGQARGVHHVLFVHGASWTNLKGDEMFANGYRVRAPFRQECLVTMSLWATDRPASLWPGDLRYYLTSFPGQYNSFILMGKPSDCPASTTFKAVRLPPFGVLFEKYKVMPWKVNHTAPFARNATLWTELQKRVHMVVLDCSDDLAAKLQWAPDYRARVTCWKESPLSKEFSYRDMMMSAQFFLGLGATGQSPTPVDLNYCRTPILMPPNQHSFIPMYAREREYYPVSSSEEVLNAVDDIMTHCSVAFKRQNDTVTKLNSCFKDPPSLDKQMDEQILAKSFRILVRSREVTCQNLPRRLVPPSPASARHR